MALVAEQVHQAYRKNERHLSRLASLAAKWFRKPYGYAMREYFNGADKEHAFGEGANGWGYREVYPGAPFKKSAEYETVKDPKFRFQTQRDAEGLAKFRKRTKWLESPASEPDPATE